MSKLQTKNELRAQFLSRISDLLAKEGEEILLVASNEIAIPCVDNEGEEQFMVIKFTVPNGSRDGDVYDGYAMAQDYQMKCADKQAKAQAQAEKKAIKIAKDKAKREQKAQARASHATE